MNLLPRNPQFNKASTDFLRLDLQTALTFTGLALQTNDDLKRRRKRQTHKACDAILHSSIAWHSPTTSANSSKKG
jgi:hypothetical protein